MAAKFKLIYDVPHDAPQYLGAIEDVTADDDTINAALPNATVGTLITTAGYHAMKQKQPDGTWKPFTYTPSTSGMVNPSDATATAGDILEGKTAYIADSSKATGTIEEKTSSDITTEDNAVTVPAGYYAEAAEIVVGTAKAAATYTPTTADQTIASGQYLFGAQTIKGDANLVAENIKAGVTIFGVEGAYEIAQAIVLSSIAITQPPLKTTYEVGEDFDPAGMVVTATYSNGATKTVTDFDCVPSTIAADTESVQIVYTEQYPEYDISQSAYQAITVTT